MLTDFTIFGVCGWSDSGKTTVVEQLISRLSARGLKVGVVKHDVHGINVDQPGKDSDRFFTAGADVLLQGPEQEFFRVHSSEDRELPGILKSLVRDYDIVLVEGHKTTPVPKVWLLPEGGGEVPPEAAGVVKVLPRDSDRVGAVMGILDEWLPQKWLDAPVYGCALVGGEPQGALVERTVELLGGAAEKVIVAGGSVSPAASRASVRLPDVPDAAGPVAGLLAAVRWAPHASWLVAATDLAGLSREALDWLLATRAPGVWAALPRLGADEAKVEPLLAHYDFRAHRLLEAGAAREDFSLGRIAEDAKVISPSVPAELAPAWQNAPGR